MADLRSEGKREKAKRDKGKEKGPCPFSL